MKPLCYVKGEGENYMQNMTVPTKGVDEVPPPAPAKLDMAVSVMSLHLNDKPAQISTKRFEPVSFDANLQTERHLIEDFMRKKT